MTEPRRTNWPLLLMLFVGALALLATGALGTYFYLQSEARRTAGDPAAATSLSARGGGAPKSESGEVAITLSADGVTRAGIVTTPVKRARGSSALRLPGVVEANAYKQVLVTAVTSGRVLSVAAELGAHVRQGQTLAELYSPELAEAMRVYLSMSADYTAADQQLARLERLVKLGAASQQELEAMRAEHTRHATDVQGARAKLDLLGLSPGRVTGLSSASQIDATVTVVSPMDGVVTRRLINRGQNVDASSELFTIVDLSTVWIVGDVYERDLGRVHNGSAVTMTSPALPGQTLRGRISYIDPQVAAGTRTSRLRVQAANPGLRLRLGMYVEMVVGESESVEALFVPRSALQTIDSTSVVYVPDPAQPGRFVERPVQVGSQSGSDVEVAAGLGEADRVVAEGSFFLRAERERLGLGRPRAPGLPAASVVPGARYEIRITKEGFTPALTTLAAGVPVEIVFTRQTDETCAKEVVIPSMNLRQPLPLNERVVVPLTPTKTGPIEFACGMDMLRGTLLVK
jgi:RND family efflux transporter MFP subunit